MNKNNNNIINIIFTLIFNSLILSFGIYTLQYCTFYDFKNVKKESILEKFNVKELNIVKYKKKLYVNINSKDKDNKYKIFFFPLSSITKDKVNNLIKNDYINLNIDDIEETNIPNVTEKDAVEIPINIIQSIKIDVKVDLSNNEEINIINQQFESTDVLATYVKEDVLNKTFRLNIDSEIKLTYNGIRNYTETINKIPHWQPIFKNSKEDEIKIDKAKIIGNKLIIKLKNNQAISNKKQKNQSFIYTYFKWILHIPKELIKIIPYAVTTISITIFPIIIIFIFVLLLSIKEFINLKEAIFETGIEKINFFNIVSIFLIPSFIIAYFCIPLIHKTNLPQLKWIIAIFILVIGDGTLGGFYQQVNRIMKEEIEKPYIVGLRAKKIKFKSGFLNSIWDTFWWINHEPTIMRHISRNAFTSILPIINNRLPFLLGSAFIVEAILNINGLSKYLLAGIGNKENIGMILTLIILCSVFTQLINFLTNYIINILEPQ